MNFIRKLPRIGMRNVKTAIAVLLCILILRLFQIESPFYACIAAVITMQNTVEDSYETGINRIIGTLIGAAMGLVFCYLNPQDSLLIFVGMMIVVYATNLLEKKGCTSIALIVFLAIMLNITDASPIYYSIMRVIETTLGIIISVLVNTFMFNPQRRNEAKKPGNWQRRIVKRFPLMRHTQK
ncbi:aromatic acid exporter family protein [Paenibacillus larvae]|uniref:FUSC family protein n=1 Tax=Paenibacillus larvae TaxID=1464 RepID=UPI00227E7518|nr:aromatic acid exporter family protein [Paenibacillus larvae]MCY9511529.1 aromatic acid exporter family protein [Paenibacillus larvae]MCY9525464.1 aromatic acid exporter family protein [Paenibacillus larvae]